MNEENNMEELDRRSNPEPEDPADSPKKPNPIGRIIFLIITAICFVYLYYRLNGAAIREGLSLTEYMIQVFANCKGFGSAFLHGAQYCEVRAPLKAAAMFLDFGPAENVTIGMLLKDIGSLHGLNAVHHHAPSLAVHDTHG